MTGALLCFILILMYVFALQWVRTNIFNAFWLTHKLYIAVYILTILHGATRLIQHPWFYFYFLGPAVLFTIDKLVGMGRRNVDISVVKAELLPSGE